MRRLQAQWASRTHREQIMLTGLGLLIAMVAVWYGVIQPVRYWQDSAAFERQAAEARLLRVTRQIEHSRAYSQTGISARSALEQAARQAGVQVQIATSGSGLGFELDRIPSESGRAFWVHLERAKLSPKTLRIDANEDGTLRVSGQTD